MSKIDWDKPLQRPSRPKQTWLYIGPDPESESVHWARNKNSDKAYAFSSEGEHLHGFPISLRNIPEEPEREEGWYWIDCGEGWTGGAAYWDGVFWSDKGSTRYDHLSEWTIGSRVYLDHEYRPANTCPPPLTGEKFEVQGLESVRIEWHSAWHVISGASNCVSTHPLEWILDKRWRPSQP